MGVFPIESRTLLERVMICQAGYRCRTRKGFRRNLQVPSYANSQESVSLEGSCRNSKYYFRGNDSWLGVTGSVLKMWVCCPDGIYRLDCVLENGMPRSKAEIMIRDSKYKVSIEGFGSFREPKTLQEVNQILARHDLWPFQATSERCPSYSGCLQKTVSSQDCMRAGELTV